MTPDTTRRSRRLLRGGVRWWAPLGAGALYAFSLPPFNADLHPVFIPFPLLSFFALIPLFACASVSSTRRALRLSYMTGIALAMVQYYWIANVMTEGLWVIILIAVILLSLIMGVYYLGMALLFRLSRRLFPRAYIVVYPAIWVASELLRGVGELSFPWMLLGYSLQPILPLAQLASVTGVHGLSFLVALGNCLLWNALTDRATARRPIGQAAFVALIIGIAAWGSFRLRAAPPPAAKTLRVACIQSTMDQNHWGHGSLDSSFAITDSMITSCVADSPRCILLPESALLCYILHSTRKETALAWSERCGAPIIFGSLDVKGAGTGHAGNGFLVYNAAFLLEPGTHTFRPYYKIKLVPFSEALPFEGLFPIISRVNLGEADFKAGVEPVTFAIGDGVRAAPFICYEIIYPEFVRSRLDSTVSLLVNITNDGWFGRSSAPYHHAEMARTRCIENGISLARCANSGISMLVNPYGQVTDKTVLYERCVLAGSVSLTRVNTLYGRWGNWAGCLCAAIASGAAAYALIRTVMRRKRPSAKSDPTIARLCG